MLNDANGYGVENRHILFALLVSLLLHMALLWRFSLLPRGTPDMRNGILQVSLTAPAASPAHIAPQPAPAAEGLPAEKEVTTTARDPARINVPAASRIPAESTTAVPTATASPSTPAATLAAQPAGLPRSGPAGAAKRVEIEFEIFSGADRQPMGKGRHVYVSENDRSFGVSIKQTVTAEEASHGKSWQLEISGQIERHGLSPLVFQMQGTVPERLIALKEISADPSALAGKARSGRMPDGILDRQSLLYQFMLMPPANERRKIVAVRRQNIQPLRIPHRRIRASCDPGDRERTHCKTGFSTGDSPEIIELWLIPDQRYLPAKVRHTDRLGGITEQVVVSLDSR
jgi:hypothetical protein